MMHPFASSRLLACRSFVCSPPLRDTSFARRPSTKARSPEPWPATDRAVISRGDGGDFESGDAAEHEITRRPRKPGRTCS